MKKNLHQLLMVTKHALLGFVVQMIVSTTLFAIEGRAQNSLNIKEVYLNLTYERTLKQTLHKIETETGFVFTYNDADIREIELKNDSFERTTLYDVLMTLSKDAKVRFKQVNDNITVTRTGVVTDQPAIEIIIQQRKITGKVTDQEGEGLPGVNIFVKGTTTGTVTDMNGNYALDVPSANSTLVFSAIGFVQQEQAVGNLSVIDISLAIDVQELSEVVVIGYGTQKKADITSAVATMDAKQLTERPIARVDQALVGQMSGVRVKQTSGVPGKGFSIQVRGTGSINAGNDPLYVVDGFPLESSGQNNSGGFSTGNPLANISPNDIESIQVLKDAAAGAIYGSRGSNGVVIITTKKGKSGKPQINFNAYTGWNETVKKLDVLTADEWVDRQVEHMNYFYVRDYGSSGASSSDTNDERRAMLGLGEGEYNVKYMWDDRWMQDGHPGLDYVDWQDLFFRKGKVQNYQISAAGGNDIAKYYVSGDYLDQEGIAIGVNYERFSARANVEMTPNKNVRFGLNLSPSYSKVSDPGVEGKDAITHIIVGMNPVVESDAGAENVNVGEFTRYAWGTSRVSPIAEAKNIDGVQTVLRNISSAFLEVSPVKDLKLKTSLNFDVHKGTESRFVPSYVTRNRTTAGFEGGYSRTNFVIENTAVYGKSFGDHKIDIIAGQSFNTFQFDSYRMTGTDFSGDEIRNLGGAATITASTPFKTKNTLLSYFGRVTYDFKERYLLQASIRRDGSSKFGDKTKWGVFPSASVGWRISEEAFMSDVDMVSDLKFRASWGIAGNYDFGGDYEHIGLLSAANYSYGGNLVNGLVPSNFPNGDLSWESSETIDIGLDAGLFENRVYVSFDYYTKRNTDLLLNIPVPSASGFDEAWANVGEVLNKGWELELNTKNIVGPFQWSSTVNFSHNENEVVKLGPDGSPILGGAFDINHNILEIGHPMFELYLVQQDGLLTTEDIENGYPMYGTQEAGDPRYVDQNNDGVIDADDRTYSGHPNPDYIWGVTNTFKYKGFDLSVLVQGQWGGKIYSTFGRAMYRTGMGSSENTLGVVANRVRWEEGKVYTEENMAGMDRKSPSTFGRVKNTDWMYASDYWRVRNITLGYDLGKLLNTDLISGARLYVTAENWFGGDKYDGGFNPEAVNNSGDDYGAFPLSKSIIFGVNLKL